MTIGRVTWRARGGSHHPTPGRRTAGRIPRTALAAAAIASALALLAVTVFGCNVTTTTAPPTNGNTQNVSGTANFTSKTPLPSDAVMVVKVVDNSNPDTATATFGETTVTVGGKNAPLPFAVPYSVSAVNPQHVYVVKATVTSGGTTLYVTKGNTLTLTQGQPTAGVAVALKQP